MNTEPPFWLHAESGTIRRNTPELKAAALELGRAKAAFETALENATVLTLAEMRSVTPDLFLPGRRAFVTLPEMLASAQEMKGEP